ncbi:hypothetical protein ACFCW7_23275 [Paenibacillus glucanolyticus]|uniref:hypothetical protein n=1 Tax=Paenibacillus glucanolyticus TaxID=59843 RepID=UPI0035E0003B
MAFDKQAPTWSAPGVEPPESKKQEGWQVNDKPPAAWLNWFMSLTAESLKELQQKAAEKSDITTINSEIEGLKQSGVDGKNRLETAIIAKEGTVSKQSQVATFEELDTGIRSIPTGTDTSDATAAAGDLINGKTAYGPNGKITGTIPDRGAGGIVTPGATDQTKAAGRYTTAITIKGVPVPAANVLTGTTIAGTPGTMRNLSAENNHMPGLEKTVWPGDRYFIRPPRGFIDGNTWVTAAEPGLTPGNIRDGVNVGGQIGTLKPNVAGSAQISINIPEWRPIAAGATAYHDIITFPAGTQLAYHGIGQSDIIYIKSFQGWIDVYFELVNNGKIFTIFSRTQVASQILGWSRLSINFMYQFYNYQNYGNTGNSFGNFATDNNPGAVINNAYPTTLRLRVFGTPGSYYPSNYSIWATGPMTWA